MDRHDRVDQHNYHEQQPNYHHYQHHHFHQQHHHPPPPHHPSHPSMPPLPPPPLPPPQPPPLPQPYPQQSQHFHHYPPPANQNHFTDQQNHDFQFNHQNHEFYPNHNHNYQHQQMNGEPIEPFGGGGFRSGARKRECNDGGSAAKLYVAPLPRTATEKDIRHLFQEHGNIVEVIFPKDKRSGQRQGYCFVKYTSLEEADRAIRALNGQHAIPGEMTPIKVRYADGERERLGGLVDKLYVGCINKQASKEEIEEIFTPYGHVEDIFIARDELKQSRGFAFVKFSQRDMALAAIKMLHGNFIMRDCDQPLVVRFADPKKPRTGELRGNFGLGGPNFGPCEPVANQSVPNFGDCMGGFPDASYSTQHYSTKFQQQEALSHLKEEFAPHCVTEPPLSLVKQLPSELSSVPLQHAQAPEERIQSSQQTISGMQEPTQNSEQQQVMQIPLLETAGVGSNSNAASSISAASAETSSPEKVDPKECDWSEHRCPDGYKYYYNCITCESSWEKPEEFALFQRSLQKRQKPHNGNQQPHSLLPVFSCEENVPTQTDLDPVQIPSEKKPMVNRCFSFTVSGLYPLSDK